MTRYLSQIIAAPMWARVARRKLQLLYIPSLALAMAIMMARPLLMARLLDIQEFAYYSAGLLVSSTFCMLGCIGLQSLLQREMPGQLLRKRELPAAILLMQCLMVALICALLGLVLSFMGMEAAGVNRGMLATSILHGLSQQAFLLASIESRSRGEPLRFSMQQLQRGVFISVSGGIAAYSLESSVVVLQVEAIISLLLSWKILAGIWKKQIVSVSAISYLAVTRVSRIPWRSATVLFAVMVTSFSLLSIDRWFAASLLPSVVFAQYAFAGIVLTVSQSVQAIVNASVFPFVARKFSKSGKYATFRVAAFVSAAMLGVSAVLVLPATWAIHVVIFRFYPEYTAAISLVTVFVLVAVLRVSDFWSSYLIIVGHERRLLVVNLMVVSLVSTIWLLNVEPWLSGSLKIANLMALVVMLTLVNYIAVAGLAYISRR